ncbi:DoxX family protein [Portibacter marinus]|uniref:DoxX family protein n=1 Tax=Portibacter marinus TaxID=2898660 RepID=UPI001F2F99D0|nr:DoxX family protein [Portibacter marinus]
MTLTTILIYVGIAAVFLTIGVGFLVKEKKDWLLTFLQNYCGALFIFSGWVKAVDPLGTAYKMEQYFAEFNAVFEPTWFSFLSPLFPFLAEYSVGFSVFMIILEIALGIMLILGIRRGFTSWVFLGLVMFFTILTGFTFLTGFVPQGVNFFEFGSWAAYNETNMKVTDCGCFGDFVKLKPRISFFKDLALLVPAFIFVARYNKMHQLFTKEIRTGVLGIAIISLFIYCLSNYKWDIPHSDFRPFKVGNDIQGIKEKEMEAAANVQVVAYKLQSNEDPSKIVELPYEVYLKEYSKYPKSEWTVLDQVKTKPAIEPTKISDFEVTSLDGYDSADELLALEGYSLWIVCHKLKGESQLTEISYQDTTFVTDTSGVKTVSEIQEKTREGYEMEWDADYVEKFQETVNPFVAAAKESGIPAHVFIGKFGKDEVMEFADKVGPDATYYTADDILLKTIIRSNPGIVMVKDGVIVDKWHVKKLPSFGNVKAKLGI